MSACTVLGCDKPRRSSKAEFCEGHYHRMRRHGTTGDQPLRDGRPSCSVPGCTRPHYGHGYCLLHGRRVTKHGDPNHHRDQSGPANPFWRGDAVTYASAHDRVARERGAARRYACVCCGARAGHWAYRHDDPNERITDEGWAYSPSPDHYDPMCVSCHKLSDLARRDGREHSCERAAVAS